MAPASPREDYRQKHDHHPACNERCLQALKFDHKQQKIDLSGVPKHPFAGNLGREYRVAGFEDNDAVAGRGVETRSGVDGGLVAAVMADDEFRRQLADAIATLT